MQGSYGTKWEEQCNPIYLIKLSTNFSFSKMPKWIHLSLFIMSWLWFYQEENRQSARLNLGGINSLWNFCIKFITKQKEMLNILIWCISMYWNIMIKWNSGTFQPFIGNENFGFQRKICTWLKGKNNMNLSYVFLIFSFIYLFSFFLLPQIQNLNTIALCHRLQQSIHNIK